MSFWLFALFLFCPHIAAAEESIIFSGFARGWAPYEMVSDAQVHGIAVDIFKAVMPEGVQAQLEPSTKPRARLYSNKSPVYTRLEGKEWMANQNLFFWSDPVMHMSDALISPATNPMEYSGPGSLKGKTIGCIRNYRYPALRTLFKKRQATRYDVNKDVILLRMVKAGRVDAAVLDLRTAYWLIQKTSDLEASDFWFSATPVDSIALRFVFNPVPGWKKHLPEINKRIQRIQNDGTFSAIISKYQ
jgi:polar amino acid transport system substrate-binding protein